MIRRLAIISFMAKRLHLLAFFILPATLAAQVEPAVVAHTLYLVGDAGEPSIVGQPLGNVLNKKIIESGSHTTVLFLGDNIYPAGMPDQGARNRREAEEIMGAQTDWLAGSKAGGIFIPGNHDWQKGRKRGRAYVNNQQRWVDSLKLAHITFLPRDGCPGPVEIPLTDNSVLVILDTQWFLHPWDKPGEDSDCESKDPAGLWILLHDIFTRNEGKRIIIAAHHPLISYGEHGGIFKMKDHLFPLTSLKSNLYIPLPLLGSIYPMYRKWFGNVQDISHPQYRELSKNLRSLMAKYPGTIYASGHEHALEYITRDSTHFVVSGSGSKTTYVKKKAYAEYAEPVRGFVKLTILTNGAVTLEYWQADGDVPDGALRFKKVLSTDRVMHPHESLPAEQLRKTIRVRASGRYQAGNFKQVILGKNYRSAWTQEVEVPFFDFSSDKGGLKVLQKGGGMQTLSLRLADSAGREFVLRSVEKFPEKAVPETFRKTFAQDLVQDQISASHPYAALLVPPLARAAGLYHTNPRLVFIPDNKALGIYRRDFANTLALFEERPNGDWSDAANFGHSKRIINTSKVLESIQNHPEHRVDETFVLRARLFDMWIGDWDRHDDQWRWATRTAGDSVVFQPIPRDRDQAFFVNEGLVPKLWSRRWTLPQFEGFDDRINWPPGLAYGARYFDRSFLTGLSRETWVEVASDLQNRLTDGVIDNSIHEWPHVISALDGEKITRKLKARRSGLLTDALLYYEFLARYVDVSGSNESDLFLVDRLPAGDVQVRRYAIGDDGSGSKTYDRLFKRSETREIRLYALAGEDKVLVSGVSAKSILLRVIGGDGRDSVIDKSTVNNLKNNTLYYDLNVGNHLSGKETGDRRRKDPAVNHYDRRAFKYNKLSPFLSGQVNADEGFFFGGGMSYQAEGFRGIPFRERHFVLFNAASATASYEISYHGTFNNVFGDWGLETFGNYKFPGYVNNFFGLGNESVFDEDIDQRPGISIDQAIDYYRYKFQELKLETYLTRQTGSGSSFKIGPAFQQVRAGPRPAENRFISEFATTRPYDILGETNLYTGASWKFLVDMRNNPRFTTRGVIFDVTGRNMVGLTGNAGNFSSYESFVSFYQTFRLPARFVFASRVGGGISRGDWEFFQAQILGRDMELRGFRKMRFYGDRKFYTNLEMRIKLFSFRTYIFPATLGILGFHDLGRVWYKDNNGNDPTAENGKSRKWHKAWGGGIWFTPFNMTVLSLEGAHSSEGTLGYVRLGFLF